MKFNIPILISFFRISNTILLITFFYIPYLKLNKFYVIIFVISSITDLLDGFIARKFKQVTLFGEFIDPIADKLIVNTALLLITEYYHSYLITIPSIIVINRDIIVTSLRGYTFIHNKSKKLSTLFISKLKTSIQMISLILLLNDSISILFKLGIIFFYIALILNIISMIQYLFLSKKLFNINN